MTDFIKRYASTIAPIILISAVFTMGFYSGKHAQMVELVCISPEIGASPLCN